MGVQALSGCEQPLRLQGTKPTTSPGALVHFPLFKDQHSQYKYDLKSRYKSRINLPSYWMLKLVFFYKHEDQEDKTLLSDLYKIEIILNHDLDNQRKD